LRPQDGWSYPAYDPTERRADAVIHALGVVFALAGAAVLTIQAAWYASGWKPYAVAVYALALAATFVASACYHFAPSESLRPLLRRIDHAAIYLKIAGTYTPLVVFAGTGFAYALLAVVWTAALLGALYKLVFWRDPQFLSLGLYILLGWLGVALIWPLAGTLPPRALALIAAGGIVYTVGVVFFVWESLKFSLAVWHAMVLLGSICLFLAISDGTFAAP
jgi:hemolysin III